MSRPSNKKPSWQDKVVLGQEAIVPEFGLGRVMSFGVESGVAAYDYIEVQPYIAPAMRKRFLPEHVNLIDPSGLILKPYKARETAHKPRANQVRRGEARDDPKPSVVQSVSWPSTYGRKSP